MKKIILVIYLLIPTFVFSQQIFQFKDDYGHILNISFSGNTLLAEQGGVVKSFNIPPYSNNLYTWVANDGVNILFTPDMTSLSLYVGGGVSYIFRIQLPANSGYPSNNNYQQYNNNQNNYNQSGKVRHTCSYCNGTGRINTNDAPDFGTGEKWCEECHKMVPASHCHGCKICPSCGGKGYTESNY